LCWLAVEQQFITALAKASAVMPHARNKINNTDS